MKKSPIPQLTDEQFELSLRLADIFLPLANKHANKFENEQVAQSGESGFFRFVHYTSADAALKIISTKRLWLRNTHCMADYAEVQHGYQMLRDSFLQDGRREAFVAALEECAPGMAQNAIAKFDTSWNDIRFHTYVACVSEHDLSENDHGRLSMWRAFGGDSSRVGLVFKIPRYSGAGLALGLVFSPVEYLTKKQVDAWLGEITENINREKDFLKNVPPEYIREIVYNMFVAAVTCCKHEGFKEEREWRAVYCPTIRSSNLMKAETEVIAGVPQQVYKIPFDKLVSTDIQDLDFAQIFDRLIIGPSQFAWPMSEAFRAALTTAGVNDAASRVWPSRIPIRS